MIDSINIEVFSDSDVGGLLVNAIETSERSGDFISTITLSPDSSSSGNRLYAIPGDTIFAKYDDHTLPKPFSKSDNQYVETFAKIDYSTLPIDRILVSPIFLSNGFGNPTNSFLSNIQMQIVGSIENQINYDQEFIYFFQIKNSDGVVTSISWIQGQLSPNQILDISQSWIPEKPDTYILETYVWNSLTELMPMSPPISTMIIVN
jgi:hypothetical protein